MVLEENILRTLYITDKFLTFNIDIYLYIYIYISICDICRIRQSWSIFSKEINVSNMVDESTKSVTLSAKITTKH